MLCLQRFPGPPASPGKAAVAAARPSARPGASSCGCVRLEGGGLGGGLGGAPARACPRDGTGRRHGRAAARAVAPRAERVRCACVRRVLETAFSTNIAPRPRVYSLMTGMLDLVNPGALRVRTGLPRPCASAAQLPACALSGLRCCALVAEERATARGGPDGRPARRRLRGESPRRRECAARASATGAVRSASPELRVTVPALPSGGGRTR